MNDEDDSFEQISDDEEQCRSFEQSSSFWTKTKKNMISKANRMVEGLVHFTETVPTKGYSTPRSLPIVVETGPSKYKLDSHVAKKIFCQESVADCLVAVYSVAGAYRLGKSFLLNFFVDFLSCHRSKDWLKDKEKSVLNGFEWRGGKDRCTPGIWVWNTPFFVKTETGEKVAVFLFDTQGTFDNQADANSTAMIFGLSTLLSSVQIYNISKNLQEDHLQSLQLFMKYGQVLKKRSLQTEGKPFQDLILLIRDYMDPDYTRFKGGDVVLEDFLNNCSDNKELKNVRNDLRQSFETLKCFCASDPGKLVSKRSGKDKSSLQLKDIDDDFLHDLDELVQYLFQDNIVVKTVNESQITGKELYRYITEYWAIFEGGQMPKVGTILEATATVELYNLVENLSDLYCNQMEEICCTYQTESALATHHETVKEETLNLFDDTPKLDEDKLAKKFREYLEEKLLNHYDRFKTTNNLKKNEAISAINHIVGETERSYDSYLWKILSEDAGAETKQSKLLMQKAEERKDEENNNFLSRIKEFHDAMLQPFKSEIQERLQKRLKRFEREIHEKVKEVTTALWELSEKSKEIYQESMDAVCKLTGVEKSIFKDTHEKSKKKALSFFDKEEIENIDDKKCQYRVKLLEEIEERENNLQETNALLLEFQKQQIDITMAKAKVIYDDIMSEDGKKWLAPQEVRQRHVEARREAERYINSQKSSKGEGYVTQCLEKVYEYLQNAKQTFQQKNDSLKESIKTELDKQVKALSDSYLSNMKKKLDESHFLEESDLNNRHEREKGKTLSFLKKAEEGSVDDNDNAKENLKKAIEAHYYDIFEENDKKKKDCKYEVNEHVTKLIKKYSDDMNKACGKEYKKPEILQQIHDKKRKELVEEFEKKWKNLCYKEPTIQKLTTRLDDEEYKKIQKINEANESCTIL